MIDMHIQNEGSVFIFNPLTDLGRGWIKENIGEDAQYLGECLVVEHRYARDIYDGMVEDGLECV